MSTEPHAPERRAPWKILLVDDEPAVHEVSRLILAGLSFDGRELHMLSAHSAAQARELLAHEADVALALLDVVMETDDAGIGLVQHIREQRGDHDMQIVLRTGQPGVAPESDIVPRYEINGYYLKTEITAQRLHSIVISGLRNYRHTRSLRGATDGPTGPPGAVATDTLALELERLPPGEGVLLQAQPEVALATNQITGLELVPHWKTSRGLLPATRVCDALPDGPARRRHARWIVEQACFWAWSWRANFGLPITVSVPLAGECLGDAEAVRSITACVRDAHLPGGALDLLVSEACWLAPDPGHAGAVDAFRAAGLTLTLADFGARTISLQRLNRTVPDRLKIHRLFVRGVTLEPERTAMARSLIALAQTLKIVAIADGICSDVDAQFFKWEGCDLGQGDALAPACAPADVVRLSRPCAPNAH